MQPKDLVGKGDGEVVALGESAARSQGCLKHLLHLVPYRLLEVDHLRLHLHEGPCAGWYSAFTS